MNLFFASDHHLFHKNILKLNPSTRPAENIEELNEKIIEAHNSVVKPEDIVYFLGDLSFAKWLKTKEVLSRMNGNIHMVLGNHDYWVPALEEWSLYLSSLQNYLEIKYNKIKVVLFHYPIKEWNKMHYGSFHLYGHVHGKYQHEGRAMDVGLDARPKSDLTPWSWEEVYEKLKDRPIMPHGDGV